MQIVYNIQKSGDKMTFDWTVSSYDYRNKSRNLTNSASGVVKSNKFFPVFQEENQEKIFKPLSKTKPLSTPYFAYSEVYWSTIINKYFDSNTPVYKLAICKNIEDEFETKYHHGIIVNSLEKPSDKLINLYEVFQKYPDPSVNITDYVNYCEMFYDYTTIFDSSLIKQNKHLANSLATQILLSILKLDQNYHYENILFKEKNGTITTLAPSIDHEFSTMFLYLDKPQKHKSCFNNAIMDLTLSNQEQDIFRILQYQAFAIQSKNLDKIILECKDASIEFLENLKCFIKDLKQEPIILENNNYLTPFNSDNYLIGHALYKEDNQAKATELIQSLPQHNPDINMISNMVYNETLISSQILEQQIEKRLVK